MSGLEFFEIMYSGGSCSRSCFGVVSWHNKSYPALLAIGSEFRQPVTLDYIASISARALRAGGWRGYAQKAAKDAFVNEARSWLAPLQQMLDAEEARLRALGSLTSSRSSANWA